MQVAISSRYKVDQNGTIHPFTQEPQIRKKHGAQFSFACKYPEKGMTEPLQSAAGSVAFNEYCYTVLREDKFILRMKSGITLSDVKIILGTLYHRAIETISEI